MTSTASLAAAPVAPAALRYGLPLAIDVAAAALAVVVHDGLNAYQAAARYTGRLSLLFFALIAVLYAVEAQRPRARALLGPFALAHLFHFACLATYLSLSETWPAPVRLLGGGLAYLMIVAMPPFQHAVDRVSPRARAVFEGVYLGWVGFIFVMSYVLRVAGKVPEAGGTRTEHLALLVFALTLVAVHVALRLRARTATRTTP